MKMANLPAMGLVIGVFLLLFAALTRASAAEPVGPKLTPRLKELLTSEMKQVSAATEALATAVASGDHNTVADLGAKVRDSFILKQSLTPEDKKDLMAAVPPEFLIMDRRFHGLAGKLANAGKSQDSELQGFYFGRLLQSCVQCHGVYASDRFKGLVAN